MKRSAALIFILFFIAFSIPCLRIYRGSKQVRAASKTYYVSTSGSDSNPGTREKPWANPAYGTAKMSPGDSLVIMGGEYNISKFDTDILRPPSGNTESWTKIRGESGRRPVLAGFDDLYCAIDISGANHIRIENLEITSKDGSPFRNGIVAIDKTLENAILKDLYIHRVDEFGIDIADTSELEIINCGIEYCGFGSIGGPEGKNGGWRNARIESCSLSYNGHYYRGGTGPGPYDRPDGFGVEPSNGPIEITRTTAEHNLGDGLDSKANNTYINRCVVANNSCDGIKLWGTGSRVMNTLIYGTGDGESGDSPWAGLVVEDEKHPNATFVFENVTIHDNPEREAYPLYMQYDIDNPIQVTMRNCIIDNGFGLAWFNDSVELVFENNIVNRPGDEFRVHANGKDYSADELEAGGLGPGNLSKDPMFVDPVWGSSGDYHLKAGSPAIDAGSGNVFSDTDLDGKTRMGNGVDIGAYEYGEFESSKYLFRAEGTTGEGEEIYLQIKNLGSSAGKLSVNYQTENTQKHNRREAYLPAGSRLTIRVNGDLPVEGSFSAVLSSSVPVHAETIVITNNLKE